MRKLQHFSLLFFFSFCFLSLQAQEEEYGLASQYSDEFDGSETASGQAYDKNKLTAGHKTLPMGTRVRVTHLDNKKSVVVRINDRGPYRKGRIIDLSSRAAAALNILGETRTEIKLEVLSKDGKTKSKPAVVSKPVVIPKSTVPVKKPEVTKTTPAKTAVPPKKRPTATANTSKPIVIQPKGKSSSKAKSQVVKNTSPTEATPEFELVTGKDYNQYDLYKVQLTRPAKEGYGVQIGVFSDYDNTMKRVAELQGQWFKNILMSIEKGANGKKKYKLILGPFPDMKTATSYKKHAKKNKKLDGFVVNLAEIKAAKK